MILYLVNYLLQIIVDKTIFYDILAVKLALKY